MPAYFNQGFSVREPMWHGLGIVLDEYPGREEAMRLAGHDFTVIERPVLVQGNSSQKPADDFKALVKSGSGDILTIVRQSYGVVQNDVLWDIVDAMVDQPNVRYETAGVLKDGAILWVLAWLDEPTLIPGDDSPIYPWIMASTTHDGSGAVTADAVSIRTVCWNTYSAGKNQAKQSGLTYTFRHSKKVMDRIEDAKMALKGVRQAHQVFMDLANDLAQVELTPSQREMFVSELIPMPAEALISDRVKNNIDAARVQVKMILDGDTIPEAHKFTGYGAFQAGIEYLDHVRGYRSKDTYMGRSLLRQEAVKDKLGRMIREVAEVAAA